MADETGDDATADSDAEEQPTDDESGSVPAGTVELLAYLDARYGDRFDAERREELQDRVADLREAGESLSEAELENGDEPAFTFAAYRGEE